jgi:hypothetical protein
MSTLDDLPWVDIGNGVSACEFRHEPNAQLHIAYLHKCNHRGLERHGGLVFAAVPVSDSGSGRDWKLEQREPLTISPSLLCVTCGHHGFITNGTWRPA